MHLFPKIFSTDTLRQPDTQIGKPQQCTLSEPHRTCLVWNVIFTLIETSANTMALTEGTPIWEKNITNTSIGKLIKIFSHILLYYYS